MTPSYLGDLTFSKPHFAGVESCLKQFKETSFKTLSSYQKSLKVSQELVRLIQTAPEGSFVLLPALDFIEKIHTNGVLDQYAFSDFELFLNQFSNLSSAENLQVRGKLAGKWIPREEYQLLFPIGMGKIYPGSHFVTAHGSPDLDTTVASFWGFVDAFAARVSLGLHLWNVPGGAPASQAEVDLLFYDVFGKGVFNYLAKTRTSLGISGLDLVSQQGVFKKQAHDLALSLDLESGAHAVVLVDPAGFYLGEWRDSDVESVRFVINLLNTCLRWYENHLHVKLISLFATAHLTSEELASFSQAMFGMKIEECEPAIEFTKTQKELLGNYLIKVFKIEKGIGSTIAEFARGMRKLSLFDFDVFVQELESHEKAGLFDRAGKITENRPHLFAYLARVIQGLDKAIYALRQYVDKLGVAHTVKTDVLGLQPHYVNYRADLDEIRSKIDGFSYLTVTASDAQGKLSPIGVVHATELYKPILGTVTLRDFCNRDETKIPPYLEVISVIDHHKSSLATSSPPVAFITDSQSSNALVAEISFALNDKFSTGGLTEKEIQQQIDETLKNLSASSQKRILQRLLQRQMVSHVRGRFFVSPEREAIEYLHYLYAILDDTDLLTKISPRDIDCVASLLNRLKSLSLKREVEIIHFDDLPRDEKFLKNSAKRILQNADMYSLYRKVYIQKEKLVEENFALCVAGKPSTVFADTKEQNGCCRIGQSKLFAKNWPIFEKAQREVQKIWLQDAQNIGERKKEIDLFIHMISTIAGADELYAGTEGKYNHSDEMWIFSTLSEAGTQHLKSFLNAFGSAPHSQKIDLRVEISGSQFFDLDQIFAESFAAFPRKVVSKEGLTFAVLKFKPGMLNSRKAMISPYLPHLV